MSDGDAPTATTRSGPRAVAPPHLVSAGAGSGKTYWIVERIVERVRGGLPLDRLAAVTFTKAAAAELADRIRARLLDAGRAEAAARVDAAAVCTIHQFALAVLRRYPLAAGLPPEPIVLEEVQSAALLDRCTAEWVRAALAGDSGGTTPASGQTPGAAFRALLHDGLGPGLGLSERGWGEGDTPTGRLTRLVRHVIEKGRSLGMRAGDLRREGVLAADRLDAALGKAGDAAALRARFDKTLADALAYVAQNPEPKATDKGLYNLLVPLLDPVGARATVTDASWLETAIRLACVREGGFTKAFAPAAPLVASAGLVALDHPAVRARLRACVTGVFDAAAGVLASFESEKSRIGALDFEDMQVLALELLTGRGVAGVAYGPLLAQTFRWIVVDEFQDTSPLQFRIFEVLREHGAEVVYVGDLKQAIYAFRTADSALFGALLAEARDEGRAPERLAVSRRSRPELVAFANELFDAALRPRGIDFDPLEADNAYSRGECPKAAPSLEVMHHPLKGRGVARGAKEHALIARLRALIEHEGGLTVLDRVTGAPRRARWGDVAILAYTNSALGDWSAALRGNGIPAALEEGELFETVEVRLARAWLRMLASPRDAAASSAVLVSELYGVSQQTMARLAAAGVLGSPARALELSARDPAALPLTAFERRALARCAQDLSDCRRMLRHLPLDEAVEAALEHVDLPLRLSLKADAARAAQIRANVRRVCEIAHALAAQAERPLDLHGATGITLENLLIALDRARDAHYTQRAGDEGDDAVKLVTIHSSKGLEYPVVVLDVLEKEFALELPRVDVARPDDRAVLLGPEVLARSGVRFVPDAKPRALAERLEGLFGQETTARQEWLRLLYVAITRAREHLIVLWPADPKSKGTTRRIKDLLVDAVSPPPTAAGEAGWALLPGGAPHRVWVSHALAALEGGDDDGAADGELGDDGDAEVLAALHAMVEDDAESPAGDASARAGDTDPASRPALSLVAPTELCRAADCPEVPRLAVYYPHEHRVARLTGEPVDLFDIASAREQRLALGDLLDPASLGGLLHQAIEHADLAPDGADPTPVVRAMLERRGLTHPGLVPFLLRAVDAVRQALVAVGAREVVAREAPFAIDLDGLVVHGAIDLVARGPTGLHVIDLKTHIVDRETIERWAAYYRPQLDAYGLALARLTGEPIAARHLVLPASGLVATLRGAFDPALAATRARALSELLAAETPGPGPLPDNDCVRCAWRPLCRVARETFGEGAGDESVGEGSVTVGTERDVGDEG